MTEVARSRIGAATHLIPAAALDAPERIAALADGVEACLAEEERQLVLDLAGVPLVNSAALELLLDIQDRLAREGGGLRVTHVNAALQDIFRVTGLAERIPSLDPDAEAGAPPHPPGPRRRIGEILKARGLVTDEMIETALEVHRDSGRHLAQVLVEKGWVAEVDLMRALSDQLGLSFLSLRSGVYDPEVARLIPHELARRFGVVPLFRLRTHLFLATADPQDVPTLDGVEDLTGLSVRPVLACTDKIAATIAEAHAASNNLAEFVGGLESDLELVEAQSDESYDVIDQLASESPVINLINGIIQRAIRDAASDVHIERSRSKCRVRLRVDGLLYTIMSPPLDIHPALVSRLKVMAGLDIAERRLPQDGRLQVMTGGRAVDLRFSSLPGIFGEKVVLRVLDKNHAILDVERLGLNPDNLQRFVALLSKSHGLMLVTGPTGSGKTTSLYAALNRLNSSEKNIVTIEDPVEYQIEGINQNQVKEGIGLGFAKILKHVLRQDPDVVMVGEIREGETAQIAVQAALTGHLVLSTLHTNDSIGAITRLLDMGIEPYLLSSALVGVMAQRLVRTVCPECETSFRAPAETLAEYGIDPKRRVKLKRGRGCPACYDSGYRGRMAIHELIACEGELQRLIVSSPSRDTLDGYLREHEVETLVDDGVRRALEGATTLEEISRVVGS